MKKWTKKKKFQNQRVGILFSIIIIIIIPNIITLPFFFPFCLKT